MSESSQQFVIVRSYDDVLHINLTVENTWSAEAGGKKVNMGVSVGPCVIPAANAEQPL